MRRWFPILLLSATCMVSCLDHTEEHYTPQIRLSYFLSSAGDTVRWSYDAGEGIYRVDTVSVGDTICFAFAGMTLANNLQSVQVGWDSASLDLVIGPLGDVSSILLDTSDTLSGSLLFPPGYNYVAFPVRYTAKKESVSSIDFTLSSDSKYSPATTQILCPVADTIR